MSTVLLPTFTCFDDALEFVVAMATEEPCLVMADDLFIVHGICLTCGDGDDNGADGAIVGRDVPYSHGWVEWHGHVIEAGMLDGQRVYISSDVERWNAMHRPQHTTRYVVRQALEEAVRWQHHGPWLPEYQALCRKNAE